MCVIFNPIIIKIQKSTYCSTLFTIRSINGSASIVFCNNLQKKFKDPLIRGPSPS